MKSFTSLLLLVLMCLQAVHAQTNTEIKTLASNLDTPWEILWGPDNMIWMTERGGKVSRVDPETGVVSEIISIADVAEVGEGGLLGMAIDPDFSANNFFYVAYNYNTTSNNYHEKIVRFTFNPANGKAGSPYILLDNISGANNHNGCRMIISPDKKLIFSTGDAQNTSTSQNLESLNGKILRMNLDGSIPQDNPLGNSLIWSWGHRNPQGMAWSPDGKILYSSEHGPSNDDELNIIVKGGNYGWPQVEGFCDTNLETAFCRDSNTVEPIFAWTPTLAVAGIAFYDSDLIPELKNSLLVTSLKAGKLTQLRLDESGTEVIESKDFFDRAYGRLRDICISPDGKIYLATSNRDGRGSPSADDDRILEISVASTAVNETKIGNNVTVFPNPAKDFVTITFPETRPTNASYSLYTVNGKLLQTGMLNSNPAKINLPANYEGLLFLRLTTDNQIYTERLMMNK